MPRRCAINPTLDIATIISYRYYNIAAVLLAEEGNSVPLIELFGERSGFLELRQAIHYKNFLKNAGNVNMYPIGMGNNSRILRPHYHVVSFLLAGFKEIPYMSCSEGTPDYGESWIENYQCKEMLRNYYPSIFTRFNLIDSYVNVSEPSSPPLVGSL